ncbi:MAG: DUF3347 domain-containing protein [bacterium]
MMKKMLAVTLICLGLGAASAFAAPAQAAKDNSKKSDAGATKKPEHLIQKLAPSYFAIRKSLGDDSVKNVSTNAAVFVKTLSAEITAMEKSKKQSDELPPLTNILKAAQPLTEKQTDIKKSRAAFGKLSDSLVDYMNKYVGLYYTKDIKTYYCSMSKHYWAQKDGDKMVNPYYGKAMADCGDETQQAQSSPQESVPGRDSVLKCEPPQRN